MEMISFARTIHDALRAAQQASSNAMEQGALAAATMKDVTAFATKTRDALRAAGQDAAVANDVLKSAEQEAAVAVEQKNDADAPIADALDYADQLQRGSVRVLPPFLG